MWEDPIVAEVHRTREKLAADFNFSVHAIFADIRKRQATLGSRLVSQTKRAERVDAPELERQANGSAPNKSPQEPPRT